MTNHYGMPKLIFVTLVDVNQHERLLGPDCNETSRLSKHDAKRKYRLCTELVEALQGHGNHV